MKPAIDEPERRREKQIKFNEEHGIVPQQIKKQVNAQFLCSLALHIGRWRPMPGCIISR